MARSNQDFKSEVALRFAEAIRRQKISKVQASRDLGVSRTALYKYLDGSISPKGPVLQRACRKWGIVLNYRGLSLGASSFAPEEQKKPSPAEQLTLEQMMQSLRDENLEVKILRKRGSSIELEVKIRLAS